MNNYTGLAVKYLKYQKKRTLLTIVGVALSAGLLFVLLTLYFSYFYNGRDAARQQADYEMVFFPEASTNVSEIVDQDYVKSAYDGRYYDEFTNTYIEHALYINVKNPYRINHYFEQICDTYGIEGQINDLLASYYMQGDGGEDITVMFLMALFISFIFAIIGVGIIRNTIQLNTIEQLKDYGVLRCVGATPGQLKQFIFRMGFYQEITGILCGMVIGYPVAFVIGHALHVKVGLHIVPMLYVLVVFIGDLYFVMQENSKTVKNISPIEAVRNVGSSRKQKKKIKARGKNLFGILFGVDGDYAYKNLMSNKKRFMKSVVSFALGIAAFIAMACLMQSVQRMMQTIEDTQGEYQLYFYNAVSDDQSVDQAKSTLPQEDVLAQIAENEGVTDVKAIYAACFRAKDADTYFQHFDETYLDETYEGEYIRGALQCRDEEEKRKRVKVFNRVNVYGYGEEEYASCKDLLVDGTLDVDANGIVLVQNCKAEKKAEDEEDENIIELYEYQKTDYQVGDTIDLVWNGKSKTYTIEGIVQSDKDNFIDVGIQVIVPLKNYFDMTGLSEGDATGVKYKLKPGQIDSSFMVLLDASASEAECYTNDALTYIWMFQTAKKELIAVAMFVVFMLTMSSLNIINTTASNLYLRRQEFAQLRVIGTSSKRLCRMVLMEGIITTLFANVIGDAIGFGVLVPLTKATVVLFGLKLSYPFIAAVIGLLISTLVLCGSIYVSFRRINRDVLQDLRA